MAITVAPTMPVVAAKERADEDHRDPETAGDRAEELRHGHQEVFGDARALQHDAHEDEERNRDQRCHALPPNRFAAKVGDTCVQPLYGTALMEVGVRVPGEEVATLRAAAAIAKMAEPGKAKATG